MPTDSVRDMPDVSLFAANGSNYSFYPICAADGDCQPVFERQPRCRSTGVGGTSASAPSFAGIMALVNQKYGRQGQADNVLYPLNAQFPAAFHDVANGTNSVPCAYSATASSNSPNCIAVTSPITVTDPNLGTATEGQIGTGTTPEYNAAAGYDLATGLGTIDANSLVTNWGNVKLATTTTTLTPSSTSFTHGTAITISGAVTQSGGTPTGNVALMTDSTEPCSRARPSSLSAAAPIQQHQRQLPARRHLQHLGPVQRRLQQWFEHLAENSDHRQSRSQRDSLQRPHPCQQHAPARQLQHRHLRYRRHSLRYAIAVEC